MYRIRLIIMASLFSLCLLLIPHPAQAGLFVDAYVGGAFSRNSEINFSILDTVRDADIDTEDSFIVGGRLGYWIGFFPWLGVALDISYFEMDGDPPAAVGDVPIPSLSNLDKAHFEILPISALVMLRIPSIISPIPFITGLKPYVGIGPTLMLTRVDFEGFDASGTALGFDLRIGLRWELLPVIGFFAEYRYSKVEDKFQDAVRDFSTSLDIDFSTHHVVGGVSLRF